jgi:20S proteasome subunit beta 2
MEILKNSKKGGFSFDLIRRNEFLQCNGYKMPKMLKTGTTICGVIFKDGVILGADTRATEGTIVSDKNCEKIHYIAPNIYCCGAGTAADTENTTGMVSSQLELHRLSTGRESQIVTALMMFKQYLFRYQGYISAALVLGGVDITGPSLYTIYPHGSVDSLPYVSMGSGSLAAMAILESNYKSDMNKENAISLVHQAICAGIFNDLGSGSNVDIVVITKKGVEILRNYDKASERVYRKEKGYTFPSGTTPILRSEFTPLEQKVIITEGEKMEI